MDASWLQASAPKPFNSLQKTKYSSHSSKPFQRSTTATSTTSSRIILFVTLLISCILFSSVNKVGAEPAKPVVTENVIDYQPRKLNYFLDSTVVLFVDSVRDTYRSADEGKTWHLIEGVPKRTTRDLILHPFDSNTAYIITAGDTHYKTTNRGESWTSFKTEHLPIPDPFVLSFHAKRPSWVIIHLVECDTRRNCHQEIYYTKDGFDTPAKKLLAYSHICQWAISSENFDEAPTELIHCLYYKALRDDGTVHIEDSKLVKSQDFFETMETVVFGSSDRAAIVHFVTKESYMLAAEKHLTTGDMTLYVSDDAKTWSKARFPQSFALRQDAYTILESTSYSLILDVKASPMDTHGTLMVSNSNGSNFAQSIQYTNRNEGDTVDFEKIQNIDGVYLVNVVDNHEGSPRMDEKKLRTRISFEAGSNWQYIMPPKTRPDGREHRCTPNADGSCSLHLHSVTSAKVAPPVFSSKAAPGVVMGVGNVGPYLLPWEDCDTYLSEDGGITWKAVLEHPHKYEFGDMGGLIVAVRDDGVEISYFQYSADRGQTWQEFGDNVRPVALTSDPESTSQKFLIFAHQQESYVSYHLDLTNVYGRKCDLNEGNEDRSDFEKWYARNLRNQPDCLMGVKTWYWRRKANAECMVREAFTDPKKTDEVCPCTDEDFECDYNYILKDGQCVLEGRDDIPEGSCKKEGDTFLGSSGYRKVPGNSCDSEKGIKKDEPKTKTCSAEHVSTDIAHSVTKFDSAFVGGLQYFLRSSVIMGLTMTGQVWRSTDDGSTWKRLFADVKHIRHIYIHDENEKLVYVITTEDVHVSHDRGENFDKHALPAPPNRIGGPLIDFHPDSDKNDWILYLGQKSDECFTRLYHSKNSGRNWAEIDSWVDKAVYSDHRKLEVSDNGIFEIAWKKPMPLDVCQVDPISTDVHPRQMVYKNIG
ncbi:vacuolar protein sorting/targeting protein PEP1, partial [Entomortierella beljakovae]